MRHSSWQALAMVLALCTAWTGAAAQQIGAPSAATQLEQLTRAHAAVVGIRVTVADGASSAESLGRQRAGSGVLIDKDGLILTIGYLMLEAQEIQIVTQDMRTVPAQAVAYDQATGFGLVRSLLPLRDIEPVSLGSLTNQPSGEPLMAVTGAQPGGTDSDLNMVQLVSKRAFSGYWEYHIDAAAFTSPPIANHSGAPLFNQQGEVIGIGSLLVPDAMGGERRLPGNMFVPVDLLKPILDEMRKTGTTAQSHRPWIGISSAEQSGRVQIIRVSKDSPAQKAGLQPGDLVLAVDGAKVTSLEALYKKLWDRTEPEGDITLTVLQGAELRQLRLQSVDRMRNMRKPAGI
ncbi:MAG: serine protease [Rhodoferax sp.]|nr:serine protease [Rhodoferax sp.]MBP9928858.1 serine protease [Rhodoferax sp.]